LHAFELMRRYAKVGMNAGERFESRRRSSELIEGQTDEAGNVRRSGVANTLAFASMAKQKT